MFPLSTPLPFHTLLLLFTKCSLFPLPSPSILHFFAQNVPFFHSPPPPYFTFLPGRHVGSWVHYVPTRKNLGKFKHVEKFSFSSLLPNSCGWLDFIVKKSCFEPGTSRIPPHHVAKLKSNITLLIFVHLYHLTSPYIEICVICMQICRSAEKVSKNWTFSTCLNFPRYFQSHVVINPYVLYM